MKASKKRWWPKPLILLIVIILLHLLSFKPLFIEKVYSARFYPVVATTLRIVTRWIPFSIGDVLYALAFLWLFIKIILFFFKKPTWKKFFLSSRNLLTICLGLYVFFLLAWGLNYYRLGIGYKMNLVPEPYSTEDLKTVTAQLINKLNYNRRTMDSLHITYADSRTTFNEAAGLYNKAKTMYPFLKYEHDNVKPMLLGTLGNYAGFLGYYNPFTGEAQVNTKIPPFLIPFTTCHEIGHQLGFASESEASFAGYLAVRSGNSVVFNYSAYFDLFGFANGELYMRDSLAARQNAKLLDTLVRKDFAAYRQFIKAYQNPLEPLLTKIYGNYLKAHNQPKGIDSYDEVVAWIIAYYKKQGKI